MSDLELLESAAKAAGLVYSSEYSLVFSVDDAGNNEETDWNPLTSDGDALRLAVRLGLRIDTPKYKGFGSTAGNLTVFRDGCPYAQTRRAVVMAAAEIGKQMTEPSK